MANLRQAQRFQDAENHERCDLPPATEFANNFSTAKLPIRERSPELLGNQLLTRQRRKHFNEARISEASSTQMILRLRRSRK